MYITPAETLYLNPTNHGPDLYPVYGVHGVALEGFRAAWKWLGILNTIIILSGVGLHGSVRREQSTLLYKRCQPITRWHVHIIMRVCISKLGIPMPAPIG